MRVLFMCIFSVSLVGAKFAYNFHKCISHVPVNLLTTGNAPFLDKVLYLSAVFREEKGLLV